MKRYRKPIIRLITSEADADLLAGGSQTQFFKNKARISIQGDDSTDDYSKGNDGWDAWDED